MSHVKSIRKCYEVYLQAMSWAYLCICFSTTTVPASLLLPQLPLLSLYLYLPASWPFFVFCKQPCSFLPFGFPPSFVWNAILLDLGIISFLSLSPWFKCDLPPKYHSTHVTFYPKTYVDFFLLLSYLINLVYLFTWLALSPFSRQTQILACLDHSLYLGKCLAPNSNWMYTCGINECTF